MRKTSPHSEKNTVTCESRRPIRFVACLASHRQAPWWMILDCQASKTVVDDQPVSTIIKPPFNIYSLLATIIPVISCYYPSATIIDHCQPHYGRYISHLCTPMAPFASLSFGPVTFRRFRKRWLNSCRVCCGRPHQAVFQVGSAEQRGYCANVEKDGCWNMKRWLPGASLIPNCFKCPRANSIPDRPRVVNNHRNQLRVDHNHQLPARL